VPAIAKHLGGGIGVVSLSRGTPQLLITTSPRMRMTPFTGKAAMARLLSNVRFVRNANLYWDCCE